MDVATVTKLVDWLHIVEALAVLLVVSEVLITDQDCGGTTVQSIVFFHFKNLF